MVDNITSSPPTNLTIEEIADSIEGYFIHKTGIRPKDWIMPYIRNVLIAAYRKYKSSFRISQKPKS